MNDADNYQDAYHCFLLNDFNKTLTLVERIEKKSSRIYNKAQILKYLSYIAQQNSKKVLNEIKINENSSELKLIRAIANYQVTRKLQEVPEEIFDQESNPDSFVFTLAGILYSQMGDDPNALQVLLMSDNLLCDFLRNRIYLKMNRLDLSKLTIDQMISKDEDALETILAQAYYGIFEQSHSCLKQSLSIFQEIQEKYGQNIFSYNCIGIAMLLLDNYEDAKVELNEASCLNSEDQDTLINLNYLNNRLKKMFNSPVNNIEKLPIENLLSQKISQKEGEFDTFGQSFCV